MQIVGLGSSGDDTLQDVGKPSHWIDAVQLRGLDQRHRQSPMPRPAIGPGKQRVLARQGIGPDRPFDHIVSGDTERRDSDQRIISGLAGVSAFHADI